MDISSVLVCQILEAVTYLITIFGIPVGIFIYLREQKRQREEREYGTFDALDNKYIECQQMACQYPELDVFDTAYENPKELTEEQKLQEEAILLIRISLYERSFLMYKQSLLSDDKRIKQWSGWEKDIWDWLRRKNFREVWECQKGYFDNDFEKEMERLSKIEKSELLAVRK